MDGLQYNSQMATTSLPTNTSSGDQSNTNNPQPSSSDSAFGVNQSSGIQPGSSTDVLNANQNGIPLIQTALPTVNIPKTTSSTQTSVQPKIAQHHINPVFLGFGALLFVLAVVFFLQINNSAKNTTI